MQVVVAILHKVLELFGKEKSVCKFDQRDTGNVVHIA